MPAASQPQGAPHIKENNANATAGLLSDAQSENRVYSTCGIFEYAARPRVAAAFE